MYRLARRLSRLSRRSLVLVSIGLVWIGYGLALLTATPSLASVGRRLGQTLLTDQLFTLRASGALWLATGAIGIVLGILRQYSNQHPRAHRLDVWGFNALLIPPLLWSLTALWSWIVHLIPGEDGNPRGWIAALVWAAMTLWVLITASWVEPQRPDPKHRQKQHIGGG